MKHRRMTWTPVAAVAALLIVALQLRPARRRRIPAPQPNRRSAASKPGSCCRRVSARRCSPTISAMRATSPSRRTAPSTSTPGAASIITTQAAAGRVRGRAEGHQGRRPCRCRSPLRRDASRRAAGGTGIGLYNGAVRRENDRIVRYPLG